MAHDPDYEPPHASSPTATILDNLELFGFEPADGEHDPRPAAENDRIEDAVTEMFGALSAALAATRSATDAPEPHPRRQRGGAAQPAAGAGRLGGEVG